MIDAARSARIMMRSSLLLLLAMLLLRLQAAAGCVRQGSGRACYVGDPQNRSSCCGEVNKRECYGGCCLACNGPVMDPRSRCVPLNSSTSHCPPPSPPRPPPLPPAPPRPCTGEVLASGIQLPCPWPPKHPMSRHAETPHYITSPPAAIAVNDGRSLFTDDFLIANSSGVRREYMQASYISESPVMSPTEPWEKRNMTYARAYSGGVWWVPDAHQFKMWYGCGTSPATDSCIGLCLATSDDGVHWSKKPLDVVPGTNIVIDAVLKSNNVWLDLDDANASRRYKLADTGGGGPSWPSGFASSYRLWSSADGVHWNLESDYTGRTSDRSTVFPNPLRSPRRWIFSIKNYRKTAEMFGRSRLYWETAGDDLFTAVWGDDEPVDWQAAEDLDPGYVSGPQKGQPAQLYNLDAFAYESIIVGYFSLFRCKANMKGRSTQALVAITHRSISYPAN
jgi:hypothetical protein